jgi:hypothetical protein
MLDRLLLIGDMKRRKKIMDRKNKKIKKNKKMMDKYSK